MPNWLSSMQQTYEFYKVDPNTWGDAERLSTVTSCSITRDLENETLGTATFEITEDIGECYIRVYLVTIQNDIYERFPLGVYLCQTPSLRFDGKMQSMSVDAYSPLIELKEKLPPVGYTIVSGANVLSLAENLTWTNVRAPVVGRANDSVTVSRNYVADLEDNWLSFLSDFLSIADYRYSIDDMGKIGFAPIIPSYALRPKWTYDDSNSSILYPSVDLSRDLYGVPNVVEVIYSINDGRASASARAVNDSVASPVSTVRRGREVVHRIANPERVTQVNAQAYAEQMLKELSSLEYTVTYSHGYCPVTVGDGVLLNYERAGLRDIKAKVIRQNIKCVPGCPVEETAIYSTNLWG